MDPGVKEGKLWICLITLIMGVFCILYNYSYKRLHFQPTCSCSVHLGFNLSAFALIQLVFIYLPFKWFGFSLPEGLTDKIWTFLSRGRFNECACQNKNQVITFTQRTDQGAKIIGGPGRALRRSAYFTMRYVFEHQSEINGCHCHVSASHNRR